MLRNKIVSPFRQDVAFYSIKRFVFNMTLKEVAALNHLDEPHSAKLIMTSFTEVEPASPVKTRIFCIRIIYCYGLKKMIKKITLYIRSSFIFAYDKRYFTHR